MAKHKGCGVSSGICGRMTFGSGELDPNGYWEFPCKPCARAHKADHPDCEVWPSADAKVDTRPKSRADIVVYDFIQQSWHESDDSRGVHLSVHKDDASGDHINIFLPERHASRLAVSLRRLYPDAVDEL